jgi:hypothetical protein
MPVGVAVPTSRNDIFRRIGSPLAAGDKMLGSRLQVAGPSDLQAMSLGEIGGIAAPHRLAAVIASAALHPELRISDFLQFFQRIPPMTTKSLWYAPA